MQPASPTETAILHDDAGRAYGVVLGGDYTSEHESGTRRLKTRLGIPHGRIRFAEMRSTVVPDMIGHDKGERKENLLGDDGPETRMSRSSWMWLGRTNSKDVQHVTRRYGGAEKVHGAWDDASFAVRGWGDEGMAVVDLLREGVADKDVAVWIGGTGNVFGRGGLVVVRHSMVPREQAAVFDATVEDAIRLQSAALATGVEERLKGAARLKDGVYGIPWFALSPRWRGDNDRPSAHPVVFWLNPTRQEANNHGWFTVEELDQWAIGEGPVPKKDEAAPKKGRRR